MISNRKSLGIALVAIFVTGILIPSAANAITTFTAGSSSGTIKVVQISDNVFSTTVGTVKCNASNKEGVYGSSSFTSVTLSASYSGCKAFGFLIATVLMNGCDFKVVGQASGLLATSSIECPAGKEITVSTLSCVMHIPAQSAEGHLKMNNKAGSPSDVEATLTTSGVRYTETAGCPNAGEGATTTSNGTLTGTDTVRAFDTSGSQVKLTVDE